MNRNYSLVKMLIVVIILLVLVLLVIISAKRLIISSNLEYYNRKEKLMIKASREYFSAYSNYLPKEVNDNTRVLLSALVLEEYIDMIKDVNDNDCNKTKSYVEVEKTSDNEYLYKAHLVCDKANYETKDGE